VELQPLLNPILGIGLGEGGDERQGLGEVGPIAFGHGFNAQGDGQVGFPDARRPEKDDVFAVGDKPAFGELLDPFLVDRGLECEVEVLESFDVEELGQRCSDGDVLFLLRGDLLGKQLVEEVAVGEERLRPKRAISGRPRSGPQAHREHRPENHGPSQDRPEGPALSEKESGRGHPVDGFQGADDGRRLGFDPPHGADEEGMSQGRAKQAQDGEEQERSGRELGPRGQQKRTEKDDGRQVLTERDLQAPITGRQQLVDKR